MAFSLAPTVTTSLALLFLFLFAHSAEAGYCAQKMRKIRISGYIPYRVYGGDGEVFYYNTNRVTAQPDSNSEVKALWRGARVETSPNNYFLVGELSEVKDDSGHRYNGVFAMLGPRNQSSDSWRLTFASGTKDFSNATGGSYAKSFSRTFYRVTISLVFKRCERTIA